MCSTRTGPSSHTRKASDGGRRKKVLIISGYTCIGKTFFCENAELRNSGAIVDMDSSKYDRGDFPHNYLEDIRQRAEEPDVYILLVSTFPGVATELKKDGYYVVQVYPDSSSDCKKEWLGRLENREDGGRESRLYKLVDQNWDVWFDEMSKRDVSKSKIVSSTEYLSTVIKEIYEAFEAYRGGTMASG